MGRKSLRVLDDKMGPQRVASAKARARDMMASMVLAQLRKQAGMTQTELAKALGISQPAVSEMESQSDMQLSTLHRLVEALGGEVEIAVRLHGQTYRLAGVS